MATENLRAEAEIYEEIIRLERINWDREKNTLTIDLLNLPDCFEKAVVGLATGNFLTIRHRKGSLAGQLRSCLACEHQRHKSTLSTNVP